MAVHCAAIHLLVGFQDFCSTLIVTPHGSGVTSWREDARAPGLIHPARHRTGQE